MQRVLSPCLGSGALENEDEGTERSGWYNCIHQDQMGVTEKFLATRFALLTIVYVQIVHTYVIHVEKISLDIQYTQRNSQIEENILGAYPL